jgi:hypothetical protein
MFFYSLLPSDGRRTAQRRQSSFVLGHACPGAKKMRSPFTMEEGGGTHARTHARTTIPSLSRPAHGVVLEEAGPAAGNKKVCASERKRVPPVPGALRPPIGTDHACEEAQKVKTDDEAHDEDGGGGNALQVVPPHPAIAK